MRDRHHSAVRGSISGKLLIGLVCVLSWGSGSAVAQQVATSRSDTPVADYFASRLSDLGDIMNFRLRGGLGLSAHARATRYLDLYGGSHDVWNLGFPSYEGDDGWGNWVDKETEHGLIFFGVDATDNTEYEVDYPDPEFDLGLHLLLVGAELGIDPVQIGDLFAGIFGIDPAGDDVGSTAPPPPIEPYDPNKPAQFDRFGHRLEYVRDNFNRDLDHYVGDVDSMFAEGGQPPIEHRPTAQFRLGLYGEIEDEGSTSLSLDTDFRLDVTLPNLEHRWELFITREEVGELPATSPTDRDNDAARIGLNRVLEDYPIELDAGVRLAWPLEAFAGVQWREVLTREEWTFLPKVRFFYESEEGFGNLTSFGARTWLGQQDSGLFKSSSAMRLSEETEGAELEQSIAFGYVGELLNPERRGKAIGADDIARGVAVQASVRGHFESDDSGMDRYRLSFIHRRPLYRNWIFLVIQPELNWENDNDWDMATTLRIGADLIFWRY